MACEIKGKVVLVTGGAAGIGLAYVKELLRQGAQGVQVGDVDVAKGEKEIGALNQQYPGKVSFQKCDVTVPADLEGLFKKCVDTYKGLDIVINNAGIMNDKLWELELGINVTATVRGSLLGLQYMSKEHGGKGGTIMNIASILGLQSLAGCPIYVGTKHFVVGFTRSFGTDFHFQKTGVRFITMCPGVTDTPLISEAGTKPLNSHGDIGDLLAKELGSLPAQPVENVATGMVTMITTGANGSVWVSEGNEPIYEVEIPARQTLRKK